MWVRVGDEETGRQADAKCFFVVGCADVHGQQAHLGRPFGDFYYRSIALLREWSFLPCIASWEYSALATAS